MARTTPKGALWVFDGQMIEPGSMSLDDAHRVVYGGFSTDGIGYDYHDTADWNSDGLPDLAVAGQADGGHPYVVDRAVLFSGGAVVLGQSGTIATWKSEPFSGLGFSEIATADIDGDGRGDLLIGAGFDAIDGVSSGAVYRLSWSE